MMAHRTSPTHTTHPSQRTTPEPAWRKSPATSRQSHFSMTSWSDRLFLRRVSPSKNTTFHISTTLMALWPPLRILQEGLLLPLKTALDVSVRSKPTATLSLPLDPTMLLEKS